MLTLVANGVPPPPHLLRSLVKQSKGLVAVDGGLIFCDQANLEPDLILGDLDSAPPFLLEKYQHVPQVKTPDQNKSDLEKAIEYLFSFPIKQLTVCGALGKRIDHTLTNICLLCRYPGKIKFESEEQQCFALLKSCELTCQVGQTLSLIPISSQVTGITTNGLKWELKDETLSKDFVGISNVCLQEKIRITIEEGDLLVTLNTCDLFYPSSSSPYTP